MTTSSGNDLSGATLDAVPGPVQHETLASVWGALYPGVEPVTVAYPQGGPRRGLLSAVAYPTEGHWHYLSVGLTEQGAKADAPAAVSGFGFEVSMRVGSQADGSAPVWPFRLLEQVARHVWAGAHLRLGDYLDLGGPIDGDQSPFTAVVLMPDIAVPDMVLTASGRAAVRQLVALTGAEAAVLGERGPLEPLIAARAARDPWLTTLTS